MQGGAAELDARQQLRQRHREALRAQGLAFCDDDSGDHSQSGRALFPSSFLPPPRLEPIVPY